MERAELMWVDEHGAREGSNLQILELQIRGQQT